MPTKKTNIVKTGKTSSNALTGRSVSKLKKAGSWESARIAGKYLKPAS